MYMSVCVLEGEMKPFVSYLHYKLSTKILQRKKSLMPIVRHMDLNIVSF